MPSLVGTAEIAELLGVSRQRVAQIIEAYDDFPPPEAELASGRIWLRPEVERWMTDHPERRAGRDKRRSGMFERFTDRARSVIVLAQEEARLLGHNHIGTEHLLLGILHEGEGVGGRALAGCGFDLDATRMHVRTLVGTGSEQARGHIPFTPRAKKVMEQSLREALALGHNYIATEHLLLGLVSEGNGVGAKLIAKMSSVKTVKATVIAVMRGQITGQVAFGSDKGVDAVAAEFKNQPAEIDKHAATIFAFSKDATPAASTDRIADALERIELRLASIEEFLHKPK